jgi:hypothetical protein
MEWLVCMLAIKNNIGAYEQYQQLETIPGIQVCGMFNSLQIGIRTCLFNEREIIDFLTKMEYNPVLDKLLTKMLDLVCLPSNAVTLVNRWFDARGKTWPIYRTWNQRFITEIKHESGTFQDPDTMAAYLRSNQRDREIEILEAHKFYTIPYFDAWLAGVEVATLCDLVLSFENQANMYRFCKFIARSELACKPSFLLALHPVIVELLFCELVNPGRACEQDLDWANMLPQWRCAAICGITQCQRFADAPESTCHWHRDAINKYMIPTRALVELDADQYSNIGYRNSHRTNMLYPRTKRVATSMRSLMDQHTILDGYYLPVVRYENLYFNHADPESKNFCGKYFFYEPDSDKFLRLGKCAFFATKVHAWLYLSQMFEIESPFADAASTLAEVLDFNKMRFSKDLVAYILTRDVIVANIRFCLEEWLQSPDPTTPINTFLLYRFCTTFLSVSELDNDMHDTSMPLFYPTVKGCSTQRSGVGDFDLLDQPICRMAQSLGLETIILQHEIGGHDCVTEILHTTPNFRANLIVLDKVMDKTDTPFKSEFPKIWFPLENGIVRINHHSAELVSCESRTLESACEVSEWEPLDKSLKCAKQCLPERAPRARETLFAYYPYHIPN